MVRCMALSLLYNSPMDGLPGIPLLVSTALQWRQGKARVFAGYPECRHGNPTAV